MYAVLNENIALRAYQLVPYAYIRRTSKVPVGLSKEDFDVLIKADGLQEIVPSETVNRLLSRRIIKECAKGSVTLTDWQRYHYCDNRLVPAMNLQITGLCNYNCIHCFNAKDNAKLQSHLSLEQIINILDQAQNCGITHFTITGGEPLVHKDIKKIIAAIYERNMFIDEFNTNGALIDQDFLDCLKQFSYKTTIKISFDGIGFHDLMRQHPGAEELAINAIKLCVQNGFPVMAQVNVNKNNLSTMPETLDLMDSLKVRTVRVIRTSESPRWVQNNGQSLGFKEYFDSMLELSSYYISKPRFSTVIFWRFLDIYPQSHSFKMENVNDVRMSQPLCKGCRGLIGVGANGNVYPCLQSSGYIEEQGIKLGNIFTDSLKDILQTESAYMQCVCTTVEKKAAINKKCLECKYLKYCGTGCPALSIVLSEPSDNIFPYTEPDRMCCYFYDNDYYKKTIETFKGYKCLSPALDV